MIPAPTSPNRRKHPERVTRSSPPRSGIKRPTSTRRPDLDSHSPTNTRRRKNIFINPTPRAPLRNHKHLTPRHTVLRRIDIIGRRPALQIARRNLTHQGLVVRVRGHLVELDALDVALRGAIGAEGGQVEHGVEVCDQGG